MLLKHFIFLVIWINRSKILEDVKQFILVIVLKREDIKSFHFNSLLMSVQLCLKSCQMLMYYLQGTATRDSRPPIFTNNSQLSLGDLLSIQTKGALPALQTCLRYGTAFEMKIYIFKYFRLTSDIYFPP